MRRFGKDAEVCGEAWLADLDDAETTDTDTLPNLRSTTIALTVPAVAGPLMVSGHTKVEVPHLLKATGKEYPAPVRALAIGGLAEFGQDVSAALPPLRLLLKDEDQLIRLFAADAVERLEGDVAR